MKEPTYWAAEWRSCNRVDGENRHLIHARPLPVLFHTRRECRQFIKARFGYILDREDLRSERWRVPVAVKVTVTRR